MSHSPASPILLLDADVICHQAAYSATTSIDWDDIGERTESHNPEVMKLKIERHILDLKEELHASQVIICLSDSENFRKELSPAYKATRKPKPELWVQAREFVSQGALTGSTVVTMPRLEGDDVIGILHTGLYKDRSVMVSIDKDMQTVPGWLFNPNKGGLRPISEMDAFLFWMGQTLTGDTTDEYKGCPGIGPKKADAILSQALLKAKSNNTDPRAEVFDAVLQTFATKYPNTFAQEALLQARLARILRHGEYNPITHKVVLWKP